MVHEILKVESGDLNWYMTMDRSVVTSKEMLALLCDKSRGDISSTYRYDLSEIVFKIEITVKIVMSFPKILRWKNLHLHD